MNTLHDDFARQAPQPERADPSPKETNHHQDQSERIKLPATFRFPNARPMAT